MRRVVVTGLGTINPLGNNVNDSWDSLINSKSGLKSITSFDVNKEASTETSSQINKLYSATPLNQTTISLKFDNDSPE